MRESYQVSEETVLDLLRQRGYNFLITRSYAVQLTRPDPTKRFKFSGAPYQNAIGGVNKAQYAQIMRYSLDEAEAADQIERICTGVISVPEVGPRQRAASVQLDETAIEKLAANRADSIAAGALSQIANTKRELEEELAAVRELRAQLSAPKNEPEPETPPKKGKRGRPKGSKNKAKAGLDAEGLPILTPEQQELLKQVQFG